jgi:hypothetical protein
VAKAKKKRSIRRKREILHAIISASIVITVIVIALNQGMSEFVPSSNEAVRLEILAPNHSAFNREQILRIYAVNTTGYPDITRNDVVELTLMGPGVAKLNTTRVTLKEGMGTALIYGERGSVTIIATWIEGEYPLKQAEATIRFRSSV